MSDQVTKTMLDAYFSDASPSLFFSSLFQTPTQNFFQSEQVEMDVVRTDEDVAIAIKDIAQGYRANSKDIYTNKMFKPPVYKESFPISSAELLKRAPGQNPFESIEFRATLSSMIFSGMRDIERKIRRAVELQCAQVLQTGMVTLKDDAGSDLFTIDYKPKASHFPTASTSWGDASDDPLGDLASLLEGIRNDGLEDVDVAIFGADAWQAFLSNDEVKSRLDSRRGELGRVAPKLRDANGAIYQGSVDVGNYKLDCYTYLGRYKDPASGAKVQYMDPAKVVLMSSGARLDLCFGACPSVGELLGQGTSRLLPELPSRMSNEYGGVDLYPSAWLSEDSDTLFGGVKCRPIAIPTAIDTFGCLDTGA